MREAKFAASVFGVIGACLIGGGAIAYNVSPQVSTRDNFEIVKSVEEETIAAETSVKTTTASVKSRKTKTETTRSSFAFTAEDASGNLYSVANATVAEPATITATIAATEAAADPEDLSEADIEFVYFEAPKFLEAAPTEAPTEPETEAETAAAVNEPETDAPSEDTAEASAEPAEENVTEAPAEAPAQQEAPAVTGIKVSDADYILLCNVVAHEAGSNWISDYNKALVAEVVMNRVNSPRFPNTVYGVLTQAGQFSGCYSYVNLGTYSYQVTDSVKRAVNLYLSDPSQFSQGYLSFWGDGYQNHFR